METEIILSLVKEFGEFYSAEGLKVTDYDINLEEYNLKLSSILFPINRERQEYFLD
jgi:hypothetical protein